MFRVMDEDGNLSLSLEEFSDGITRTGLDATQDEIRIMFELADADSSGSVNVSEFLEKVRVVKQNKSIGSVFYSCSCATSEQQSRF